MLTLYLTPGSSSMAAHIALHEVGAALKPKLISLTRGENRSPAFLALNPEGKVPLLLVDGRSLTEVAAILFYLARRHPEAGLLPTDPEAEAQAISWMSYSAATLHPSRSKGPDHAVAAYRLADQRLGDRQWVAGQYSVADIHLFRLFWRIRNAIKPPPGTFPNLEAHHDRVMARPAVQRTIADETAIGYDLPA